MGVHSLNLKSVFSKVFGNATQKTYEFGWFHSSENKIEFATSTFINLLFHAFHVCNAMTHHLFPFLFNFRKRFFVPIRFHENCLNSNDPMMHFPKLYILSFLANSFKVESVLTGRTQRNVFGWSIVICHCKHNFPLIYFCATLISFYHRTKKTKLCT